MSITSKYSYNNSYQYTIYWLLDRHEQSKGEEPVAKLARVESPRGLARSKTGKTRSSPPG